MERTNRFRLEITIALFFDPQAWRYTVVFTRQFGDAIPMSEEVKSNRWLRIFEWVVSRFWGEMVRHAEATDEGRYGDPI